MMSTTDGWLKLKLASCVVRKTRSLDTLVLCSMTCCEIIQNTNYHTYSTRFSYHTYSQQKNQRTEITTSNAHEIS